METSLSECLHDREALLPSKIGHALEALHGWLAGRRNEAVMILFLNHEAEITGRYFCEGTLDRVGLPVREIITRALSLECSSLLLGHNHPSGDPQPSAHDIIATRRLYEAAAMLKLDLIDHCIFAGDQCFSFRTEGLM